MVKTYDNEIKFLYPENWTVETEESETGWTVSVYSPGTSFLSITCDSTMPTTEEMLETTLEALRSEYPQLDARSCVDTIAGQAAIGHDIEFFSLDMTNTCWTRSFYSSAGTVLLLGQGSDLEEETYLPVLRAICASLQIEEREEEEGAEE